MKSRFVAAPGGLSEFSPFCVCAAVLALALSIAPSQTTAQTMKVKGGMEYKTTGASSCKPLPTTAVKSVPSPQLRVAPPGAAKQPPLAPSVPSAPSVLMPAASTTWNILPNNSLEYCVNAGVVNDGSGPSGAPLTLTLNDYCGSGDASYREEFAANLDGTPTFPPHVSAPPRTSILTNPVPAHSAAAAPNSWCSTLSDWRKRPHLQLTLTASGLAQPVTCFVEFKEKIRVVAPQQ